MSDRYHDVTSSRSIAPCGGAEAYSSKTAAYFAGARQDYVAELPRNASARVLEIGCSDGGTGSFALSEGKCGFYCGVEISERAAAMARERISEVVVGDIEKLDLPWGEGTFDVLILSEIVEHLVDPWAALRKLRPLMKPGSLVFASSPNVSHYGVISMLLRGEWNLTDFGLLDRTHLRWFTPKTYREAFESCGYSVDRVRELRLFGKKVRAVNLVTFGRFRHLFMTQIDLRAHCS
jgi:2-polyprenyl-3-methyl-5-hydroxy-6-metoxy-1,4-benzoquinol methylase